MKEKLNENAKIEFKENESNRSVMIKRNKIRIKNNWTMERMNVLVLDLR